MIIYTQFKGEMVKINEPIRPNNTNFLIRWNGMDWSGFRTLEECEQQFPELKDKKDRFTIEEV